MSPIHILRLACLASQISAGCAHVPVRSMLALSRVDLARTDLSALRAAVRLPDGYAARGTRMIVDLRIDGQEPRREEFALEPVVAAPELAEIAAERRAGAILAVYRLPEAAIRRFETVRAEIATARVENRRGGLSISLGPDLCYRDEPPRDTLVFSSYLRTSETGTYVPLLADFDVFARKEAADKARGMPKC